MQTCSLKRTLNKSVELEVSPAYKKVNGDFSIENEYFTPEVETIQSIISGTSNKENNKSNSLLLNNHPEKTPTKQNQVQNI